MPGFEFPGQTGFPTPDDVPEDEGYIIFRFPNSNDWAGLIMGAAQQLTYPWNFSQWGALTPDEAADAWRLIVQQAPHNLAVETVDTPYWDDSTDVDDEMSIDDQPWYGRVEDPSVPPDELTFIEDAAIWAFTGLIAVATVAEVGFAPAIAFRTIAPKFVVAIRTGDLGRIIRLFVDGSEAARVEDDGSGDIVEMQVVADPDLEDHQIYITSGAA